MANVQSLMDYLQTALPTIPANPPQNSGSNTSNTMYSFRDIQSIGDWTNFDLSTILQRYRPLLIASRLQAYPFPASPPRIISVENTLRSRISEMIHPRIRRALRAGFNQMGTNLHQHGLTSLLFDVGDEAETPNSFRPDLAYFDATQPSGTAPNRAPGDVKPSWKWGRSLSNGTRYNRQEFRQVLSQLNWYMKQHRTRYGFILTDDELVAVKRLDNDGNLELSQSIQWDSNGTATQPQLTVLLALWYLGMLAAHDQGPDQWQIP